MALGAPADVFTLDSATDGVLNSDYLDGDVPPVDVTAYVQEVRIQRGRQDQLANFSAGNCSVVLLNNDRRFDPTNTASPYWDALLDRSGISPRRKVTVRLGNEDVFVGRITDIDLSYSTGKSSDLSQVTVSVADDFVLLANAYTTSNLTPTEELTGARLNYLLALDAVDYQGNTDINTGTVSVGAYQIAANTNVLTYAQAVAQAEQGYFFVARDGTLTFTDRVSAVFASSVGAFSDTGGTGIKYQTLGIMYGQEFLYNKIVVTRDGGTPQIANDTASQTEYGISTLSLSNLLLATDASAATLATHLLGLYSEPAYRFDNMGLLVSAMPQVERQVCNRLELGDLITVERNYQSGSPTQLIKYQSIERLTRLITPNAHRLEVAMADAYIVNELLLNDATFGVLDADNALA